MNYQWMWQGKFVPIKQLNIGQLLTIQKTLVRNKGTTWFNIPSVDWRKAISIELQQRNSQIQAKNVLNKLNNYKQCINRILGPQQRNNYHVK